jgi:hypothetical protein
MNGISAKPLTTLWFSKAANFSISRFPMLSRLAADFVSRFIFAMFSGRWAEVGHGVFFTEQFTLYSAFWKTKFRSCHRAASNICRGDPQKLRVERLPPPLGTPDLEPGFRAAFADYSATAALDARVEPVPDET